MNDCYLKTIMMMCILKLFDCVLFAQLIYVMYLHCIKKSCLTGIHIHHIQLFYREFSVSTVRMSIALIHSYLTYTTYKDLPGTHPMEFDCYCR